MPFRENALDQMIPRACQTGRLILRRLPIDCSRSARIVEFRELAGRHERASRQCCRILVGGVRVAAEACDSQLERSHGQSAAKRWSSKRELCRPDVPEIGQALDSDFIEPSRRCIRCRPAISGVGIAPQWNGAPATNQEAEQFSRGNGAATGKATQLADGSRAFRQRRSNRIDHMRGQARNAGLGREALPHHLHGRRRHPNGVDYRIPGNPA